MDTCTPPVLAAPPAPRPARAPEPPLCVDLDGTLLSTDTLWETALAFLKAGPWRAPLLCLWLIRGRAHLKRRLAQDTRLDPATLPYTQPLLDHLKKERARGRDLILVSGCDRALGETIAQHLGCFSEVLASDGTTNLTGPAKAHLLNARFGRGGYDYAGNERADLPVWETARHPIAVNAPARVVRRLEAIRGKPHTLAPPAGRLRALLRALRPHQYAKNLLVFVPVLTAHAYFDWPSVWPTLLLFTAWSLAASGNYILNDLLDLDADRRHPAKRLRPFAAGDLPLPLGLVLAPLLLVGGLALAAVASPAAALSLLVYLALAFGYSFSFKKRPLVDVFSLAFLFTLRVVGGGFASGHPVSTWLLVFSGFLFLGLAFLKRCSELIRIQALGRRHLGSRGYGVIDLSVLQMFGVASAFMAILVLGLYLNSAVAEAQYRWPAALWLVAPCVLLWVCRLWLATARGEMHDDPLVYSMRDRVSWLMGLGVLAGFVLATLGDPAAVQHVFGGAA